MKNYSETIAPGMDVQVCDYETTSGDYCFRIIVEMNCTAQRGPESEYEPVNATLYTLVNKVMSPRRAGQAAPGTWDVRDKNELAEILLELRSSAVGFKKP